MKILRLIAACAVATGASVCLFWAADSPDAAAHAAAPHYGEKRSFAQPVRPDPVGTNIAANRAFWGAPPPMPHSFAGQRDGRACLECHVQENHAEKEQEAIKPVPHPEFSQCQQCHVNGAEDSGPVFRENNFVGLDFPGKGSRAHPYAPPTIPHRIFMRENCLACHGPAGQRKIASPHPERSQCQQCHVPDAAENYLGI
jgi:nitrate reductase cytochrome c-type subunit